MKLEHLYRVRFTYGDFAGALIGETNEGRFFGTVSDARAEGRISGSYRGVNHPHRRADGTFEPDFQGVIDTDDGAHILFDVGGYGRAYPAGARQIVGWARHYCDDERYRWLNDSVCAVEGEVREDGLIVDYYELVWEPIAD